MAHKRNFSFIVLCAPRACHFITTSARPIRFIIHFAKIYYFSHIMSNKPKIIAFLCLLFVVFSINSFGNSIANTKHSEETEALSQNSHPEKGENIISFIGILQPSIKINESNNFTFQNFKNSKKSFNLNLSLQSFLFSKSCYAFYCSNRTNNVNTSPFYIAYHRLII